MGDFGASVVRTVVPIIAGAIISFLVTLGVEVDEDTTLALTTALTGIFTAVWYVLFRFLEVKVGPAWGWFLGLAKEPTYVAPSTQGAVK